jgi:hypothetical protein
VVYNVEKTKFRVKWNSIPEQNVQYLVELDDGSRGANWREIASVEGSKKKLTHEVDNLEAGKNYLVRIKVVDADKNTGPPSKPVSVTLFREDTTVDLPLLRAYSSQQLEQMTFVSTPKWFSAHRSFPILAWIEIGVVVLALLYAIALNVVASSTATFVDETTFQFAGTLQILVIVEIILIFLLIVCFIVRLKLYSTEKEIVRFVGTVLNAVSNLAAVVALIRAAASTLVSIFYLLMLIREILFIFVDKYFYAHWLPPKRRKIINMTFTVLYLVMYSALVVIGVVKIILKGIDVGFTSTVL